jgi:D-arabinose 1-dehydrogenase-like Zn-dependent alcohol dehydrogenase
VVKWLLRPRLLSQYEVIDFVVTHKENSNIKAIRQIEVHRPLQMQELDVPTIGQNDVLVRVKAAGICHTDVHYRAGESPIQPLPRTLGHEIAGVVEQVGTRSQLSKLGTGSACITS